jgi:uncharacterized protein
VKNYRKKPWLNPKVEIRASRIDGKGMFAKESIAQCEIIAIWGGSYVSKNEAEQAKIDNPDVYIQQIEDDVFEVWTKEKSRKHGESDPTHFHNHSCNPNTWMEDEVTISAMRNIDANEELTIDYAMFETKEEYVMMESCMCGSSNCRKRVTGSDWKMRELQNRYVNHFSPIINRRIADSNQ